MKYLHQNCKYTQRLVFLNGSPEGAKAEAQKSPEVAKQADVSTPEGRQKVFNKAQEMITEIEQKAEQMKAAGDQEGAGKLEFKARRLRYSLEDAQQEHQDFMKHGVEKDSAARLATSELLKRMDRITNPPKPSGKPITSPELKEYQRMLAAATKGLEKNPFDESTASKGFGPKPEQTADLPKKGIDVNPKPVETASAQPTKAPEIRTYGPSNALKSAVRNYATQNFGDSVKLFTDPVNKQVYEVHITNNTDPYKGAQIVYYAKGKADSGSTSV